MSLRLLGISAYYHDSAAALLVDGAVVAAAQEERFSRIRHDPSFPRAAVRYVLAEAGISSGDLDGVAFYDKPFLKFERLLETIHAFAPAGWRHFATAMPVWIKEKLFLQRILRKEFGAKMPIYFPEHHLSHAASAFYPSPYEEAAILTLDGVGEWATTMIGHGGPGGIRVFREMRFPHSLGLLYSAFTYYLGFRVNSGEYKVMGLAPYGTPGGAAAFKEKILSTLVDLREDGSFLLNMDYFDFPVGLRMTRDDRWKKLFGFGPRLSESPLEERHANLALAIQEVTNRIVEGLARTTLALTGSSRLVMAGGVALNCVSNTQVMASGIFREVWVQPAAGDAGGALGAAYATHHLALGNPRVPEEPDGMKGALLGPAFSDGDIEVVLRRFGARFRRPSSQGDLVAEVAGQLADGKVVGWFQGRMEFGPRALGNRSILADPRRPGMQQLLNQKVKLREGFRPFAPAVLDEEKARYFGNAFRSPYMLFVEFLREEVRGEVPAVTHLDNSARVQTVTREGNPLFWKLLRAFLERTGCAMLVNTSFNVRGEPIVCTPEDALLGFARTEIDILVIGPFVLERAEQDFRSSAFASALPNFAPD